MRTPRVNVEDLLMTMVLLPAWQPQRRRRWDLDRESGQTEQVASTIWRRQVPSCRAEAFPITAAVTGEFDVFTALSRASGGGWMGVGGLIVADEGPWESAFEASIVEHLVGHGWLEGVPSEFSRLLGLEPR